MDRKKEISDLIDQLAIVCDNKREEDCDEKTCYRCQAEFLIDAGYRKADEVRKETLQEIDKLAAKCGLDEFRAVELRKYAKQLGVEVDE